MITQHPGEETLLAHAAGRLSFGLALVVGTHVEQCAHCARSVGLLEAVGGALLEQTEPVQLAPEAFANVLGRIETTAPAVAGSARLPGKPGLPAGMAWPASMRDCSATRWQWLSPGMRWSRVTLPDAPDANVFLLRIGAGKALPRHTHSGREFTQVIYGRFSDDRGRYATGDFDETDDEVRHQPVVEADGECICLAAVDGRVVFDGLIARVFSSMVGL